MAAHLNALLILVLALPNVAIAADGDENLQRSAKQEAKRNVAIAKLTPVEIARSATIKDDVMEPLVTFTTEQAFSWKGGFTDRVRSDNFLRAFADREREHVSYQIYQTISYTGDARRFYRVNIMLPTGLKTLELVNISYEVDCPYGVCVHTDNVGISLSDKEVDAIAALYKQGQIATLKMRFKSQAGLDWNDDIAAVEFVGLLEAISSWKARMVDTAAH